MQRLVGHQSKPWGAVKHTLNALVLQPHRRRQSRN